MDATHRRHTSRLDSGVDATKTAELKGNKTNIRVFLAAEWHRVVGAKFLWCNDLPYMPVALTDDRKVEWSSLAPSMPW